MEAGPIPSTARPPATIRGSAGGGPMPPAPRRCPGRRRSVTAVGSEGKGTSQGEAGFAPRQPHGAACGAGGQLWQQAAGRTGSFSARGNLRQRFKWGRGCWGGDGG